MSFLESKGPSFMQERETGLFLCFKCGPWWIRHNGLTLQKEITDGMELALKSWVPKIFGRWQDHESAAVCLLRASALQKRTVHSLPVMTLMTIFAGPTTLENEE